jgi:hypothetical protein
MVEFVAAQAASPERRGGSERAAAQQCARE